MVSKQWVEGFNQQIFGNDSTQSISRENLLAGFVAGVIGTGGAMDMMKAQELSLIHILSIVLVVSTHYATQPIENLYLNMAAKIIMVAGLYALVLWKLQSTISRESIEFLLKKKRA